MMLGSTTATLIETHGQLEIQMVLALMIMKQTKDLTQEWVLNAKDSPKFLTSKRKKSESIITSIESQKTAQQANQFATAPTVLPAKIAAKTMNEE